jgi:hypothetical protein
MCQLERDVLIPIQIIGIKALIGAEAVGAIKIRDTFESVTTRKQRTAH